MNRHERRVLVRHAATLTTIGNDLAKGRLDSDQVAKWLRILAFEIQFRKEDFYRSATYTWLEAERKALREYREEQEL